MKGDKGNVQGARRAYTAGNEQAAQIILRDPARYPAGSVMQQWATLVMAKATATGERTSVAPHQASDWNDPAVACRRFGGPLPDQGPTA